MGDRIHDGLEYRSWAELMHLYQPRCPPSRHPRVQASKASCLADLVIQRPAYRHGVVLLGPALDRTAVPNRLYHGAS